MRQYLIIIVLFFLSAKAGIAAVINLSCDGVNGEGKKISTLISIDTEKKFVHWQEPARLLEFTDGANSKILKKHFLMPFLVDEAPVLKQFVEINKKTIVFGATNNMQTVLKLTIDRSNGMLSSENGRSDPCRLIKDQAF